MKGTVYILKSLKNNTFYIGSTSNLNKRLKEHDEGWSKYTKNILPMKLVFQQEFLSLQKARKIEKRIKKLKRKDLIEQIIKDGIILLGR